MRLLRGQAGGYYGGSPARSRNGQTIHGIVWPLLARVATATQGLRPFSAFLLR